MTRSHGINQLKTRSLAYPNGLLSGGMSGWMFLKSCLKLSDEKLIERFNTHRALRLFCGRLLKDNQKIRDKAIVSRIRTCIVEHADWQQLQRVLLNHWKRDMNNTHVLLMDATCYESYVRFPADVKLLRESTHRVFENQCLTGSESIKLLKNCTIPG